MGFLNFLRKKINKMPFFRGRSRGEKIVRLIFLGGFCSVGIVFLFLVWILFSLPEIDEIRNFTFAQSTQIFDRTGETQLYAIHGDENRKSIPLEKISQNFIDAILAAEDDAFFSHPGFDLGGILKAACHETSKVVGVKNFFGLCPPRGGSTLTQQLVKNAILSNEKKISRKVKEWFLAAKIEKNFSKDEILQLYLNQISFGAFCGVQTAAEIFFGKNAADLTIAESAILAALIQRPTFYSPWGNHAFVELNVPAEQISRLKIKTREDVLSLPGNTLIDGLRGKFFELAEGEKVFFPGRANWVLSRMLDLKKISETQFAAATVELKNLEFKKFHSKIIAPHFVMFVKEFLEEKFGKEIVQKGGLKVVTTLDLNLQKTAEEIVAQVGEKNAENFNAKNSALLATGNKNGEILAMVGSRNFFNEEIDGNVNVFLQRRLPGSSFKPVVYAAGFATGKISPATVFFDVETKFGETWTPQNYDGNFSGPVSVRTALGKSLNIPAVKSCIATGAYRVVEISEAIGISLPRGADFYGNAVALGAGEVRGLDLAQGFSVFATGGKKIPLISILKVTNRAGAILLDNSENAATAEEVIDPQVANLITDILSDPTARGDGWNSRLQLSNRPNAVKTGTSNKKIDDETFPFDTWTVGFTPQITAVAWSGNNDGSVLKHEASGFSAAAPIWKKFMDAAHADLPAEEFQFSDKLKIIAVSKLSGKLPAAGTPAGFITEEKFADFSVPEEIDNSLYFVKIDRVSRKRPNKFTPPEAIETRAILNFHAFFPEREEWQNPVEIWQSTNSGQFLRKLGVDGFLSTPPSGVDKIHTAQTAAAKPKVKIISPEKNAEIFPVTLDVVLQIDAPNLPGKTQVFLDEKFLKENNTGATEISVFVPRDLPEKEFHDLKVVFLDRLFYSAFDEIKIKFGADREKPNLKIVAPQIGQSLSRGEKFEIITETFDRGSAVRSVEIFLNEKRIHFLQNRPFRAFTQISQLGENILKIRATDFAGNSTEIEQNLFCEKSSAEKEFKIFLPAAGEIFALKSFVPLKFSVPAGATKVTIFSDGEKTGRRPLRTFENLTDAKIITTGFKILESLQLYGNVSFADGRVENSPPIAIETE